jgi:hypothetical protein
MVTFLGDPWLNIKSSMMTWEDRLRAHPVYVATAVAVSRVRAR